jgi:starch synthase
VTHEFQVNVARVKILFLSSEVAPFSKSGGLGDVSAALPKALAQLGHELTVVTPLYAGIDRRPFSPIAKLGAFTFLESRQSSQFRVVFAQCETLFGRPGLYGALDDATRFFRFTEAALLWASQQEAPDVIHAHDWQTGFAPYLARKRYPSLARCKHVFTIHNLAYQGNFSKFETETLGLPWSDFTYDCFEFHNQLSFMKAGLQLCDTITTVSPSYANEILSAQNGFGFDDLLKFRRASLVGILNGVDTSEWNPATDVFLPAPFSAANLSGKLLCKQALQARLKLPQHPGPVFGIVGRMVEQKGVDLMQAALAPLLEHGCQAVVLGEGEARFEHEWQSLAQRFPKNLSVTLGFNNALAHLIEAGSDFFLMPSRFEPCGLNQMYSMLYGAVPIVNSVGGLKDTVIDLGEPGATGIAMKSATLDDMRQALWRATDLFKHAGQMAQVQHQGMSQDFSWTQSAKRYASVYR